MPGLSMHAPSLADHGLTYIQFPHRRFIEDKIVLVGALAGQFSNQFVVDLRRLALLAI